MSVANVWITKHRPAAAGGARGVFVIYQCTYVITYLYSLLVYPKLDVFS